MAGLSGRSGGDPPLLYKSRGLAGGSATQFNVFGGVIPPYCPSFGTNSSRMAYRLLNESAPRDRERRAKDRTIFSPWGVVGTRTELLPATANPTLPRLPRNPPLAYMTCDSDVLAVPPQPSEEAVPSDPSRTYTLRLRLGRVLVRDHSQMGARERALLRLVDAYEAYAGGPEARSLPSLEDRLGRARSRLGAALSLGGGTHSTQALLSACQQVGQTAKGATPQMTEAVRDCVAVAQEAERVRTELRVLAGKCVTLYEALLEIEPDPPVEMDVEGWSGDAGASSMLVRCGAALAGKGPGPVSLGTPRGDRGRGRDTPTFRRNRPPALESDAGSEGSGSSEHSDSFQAGRSGSESESESGSEGEDTLPARVEMRLLRGRDRERGPASEADADADKVQARVAVVVDGRTAGSTDPLPLPSMWALGAGGMGSKPKGASFRLEVGSDPVVHLELQVKARLGIWVRIARSAAMPLPSGTGTVPGTVSLSNRGRGAEVGAVVGYACRWVEAVPPSCLVSQALPSLPASLGATMASPGVAPYEGVGATADPNNPNAPPINVRPASQAGGRDTPTNRPRSRARTPVAQGGRLGKGGDGPQYESRAITVGVQGRVGPVPVANTHEAPAMEHVDLGPVGETIFLDHARALAKQLRSQGEATLRTDCGALVTRNVPPTTPVMEVFLQWLGGLLVARPLRPVVRVPASHTAPGAPSVTETGLTLVVRLGRLYKCPSAVSSPRVRLEYEGQTLESEPFRANLAPSRPFCFTFVPPVDDKGQPLHTPSALLQCPSRLRVVLEDIVTVEGEVDDRDRGSVIPMQQRLVHHVASASVPILPVLLDGRLEETLILTAPPIGTYAGGKRPPRLDVLLSFSPATRIPTETPPAVDPERVILEGPEPTGLTQVELLRHYRRWAQRVGTAHGTSPHEMAFAPTLRGPVFVCRLLNTQWPGIDGHGHTIGYLARLAASLPFLRDATLFGGSMDVWTTPGQAVSIRAGDWEEHALLLTSLLLTCGYDAVCAAGGSGLEGAVLYVMVFTDSGTVVIDPVDGRQYTTHDACPYLSLDYVFNAHNLYANVQSDRHPMDVEFPLSQQRCWAALIPPSPSGAERQSVLPAFAPLDLSPPAFVPPAPDVTASLTAALTHTLASSLEHWRVRFVTRWDKGLAQAMLPVLQSLEAWRRADVADTPALLAAARQQHKAATASFHRGSGSIHEAVIEQVWTDSNALVDAVQETGVHKARTEGAEFALSVYLAPYSPTMIHVWVYVACVTGL
ncbi:hypothetical protein KIPB_004415 [Kipferlia bialata]|uniref:Uncharacterized protein n=1 Tax=Kipferlia bialata TaxID=797122 RepID=A0A391NVU4_9EUKA|nr:hypothetical protein KIPB_004415 [Kipferlia bialata]|eukprot:g4415.t1